MRLELPPGLGNQWRTLRLHGAGSTPLDFTGQAQPTALRALYGGIFTPLQFAIGGSDTRQILIALLHANESDPPTGTLDGLWFTQLTAADGTVLDPNTAPRSQIFPADPGNQVTARDSSLFIDETNAIVWDPRTTDVSGGCVTLEANISGDYTRIKFTSDGWYMATPSLEWNDL